MNEFLIMDENNLSSKYNGIYYTINDRFYVIYTNMEKDENGYVILHIAKVLKEVNNTPDGIVATGKYIGIDMTDQSEWDNVKINIGEIISNKQNNTPVNVTYLPINEIDGISIKSSKIFKLREDIINLIINNAVKEDINEVANTETTTPVISNDEQVSNIEINNQFNIESNNNFDNVDINGDLENNDISIPNIAPSPFDLSNQPVIPETVVEEKPLNPYDVIQQQREEEMVNTLATDDMQDIKTAPVFSVNDLENVQEPPAPMVNLDTLSVDDSISAVDDSKVEINNDSVAIDSQKIDNNGANESFVDSIIADVSGMIADDKNEPLKPVEEEKADYEQLYNDALEKTVELEKELKELHNKLNNIKNIVE